MSFTEAIRSVFQKYVTFGGRARRSEYWWFFLFNSLVSSALSYLVRMTDGSAFMEGLSALFSLAVFLPGLAVAWRRLHDVGKSGANWFWIFLPIVGWILLLVWLARPGQAGPNRYGLDPKDPTGGYSGGRAPWEY